MTYAQAARGGARESLMHASTALVEGFNATDPSKVSLALFTLMFEELVVLLLRHQVYSWTLAAVPVLSINRLLQNLTDNTLTTLGHNYTAKTLAFLLSCTLTMKRRWKARAPRVWCLTILLVKYKTVV